MFDGQGELKSCALAIVSGGPQAATVRLDNRPAYGQAHARALRLGREEGVKDFVSPIGRQSYAGIAHRDQHVAVGILLRLDCEVSCRIRFIHRIDTVKHEVQEDLLQLYPVRPDNRQFGSEVGMYGNPTPPGLASHQADHRLIISEALVTS
jgi:hypothetical protein